MMLGCLFAFGFGVVFVVGVGLGMSGCVLVVVGALSGAEVGFRVGISASLGSSGVVVFILGSLFSMLAIFSGARPTQKNNDSTGTIAAIQAYPRGLFFGCESLAANSCALCGRCVGSLEIAA